MATAAAGMRLQAATDLADKVAALSRADFYGEGESNNAIVCIETHMSWVFLTSQYAYKLKKPVRSSYLDFSTLAARERYCREEVRLNRRLAPSVYLDVVPLRRTQWGLQLGSGPLAFDGSPLELDRSQNGARSQNEERGEIVDYLIKMVRLPSEKMLDRALAAHTLQRGDLRAIAAVLTEFYRRAEKAPMTAAQYRARFTAAIDDNRAQLCAPHYGLPHATVTRIAAKQLDYVATANEFVARAAHVVDAHGDLRPEHIYLGATPLIIDCLEFQNTLRELDPIDELAFLALELTRLGAAQAGNALLRMYRILSRDNVSPMLIAFYQSHRAMVRAVLAIWHLDDPTVLNRERWYRRALTYLDIAEHAIEKAMPMGIEKKSAVAIANNGRNQ